MEDAVESEFSRGVSAYWGGEEPHGWNDKEKRERSPFIMGWYMASMWEVQPGWITDEDGCPLQEED